MALGFCLGFALFMSVWPSAQCVQIPNGVLHMECRDRYFMIAVDHSFIGGEPHFEAVDGTGVYLITEQYAALCGYTVSVLPLRGHVELRASYFSCHTDNKGDQAFTFHFNLRANHGGEEVVYALNNTCTPALAWSPREVSCETNYMEVSVRSDVVCPTGTKKDDWNAAVQTVYNSATSDWQVMFHLTEEQLAPMNLSDAHKQGYWFDLTDGRLVLRTPYGQPNSFSTEVTGVPVEVVHATLFSRQSWVVLMVDLVAACSINEGSYDDHGYMLWETPEALHPLVSGVHDTEVNVGVNGELVAQSVAQERGYVVEKHNDTVHVSIPYYAEGGNGKSFVSGDLYKFYIFHLYLEQISVDEDHVSTRLRFHRTLTTPLLPSPVFTQDGTIDDEHVFTIYLGDVPQDVELAAVALNGKACPLPFANTSLHTVTPVVQPNNTHGYTLKVPFDDPVVTQKFSKEDAAMKHQLDINYTLMVLPENEPFYHVASVWALTDVSPPEFDAVCSASGISFKLNHRPFDYLWYVSVASEPLTPELAAQHGYIMTNGSQSLLLEVPLFSHGYDYKDVTLKGFQGTFEIHVRDRETSEVQSSAVKTCPFAASEFILCSTDGRMTVVADLSLAVPSGGIPARANLLDKYCGPKEADDTRALFSFPLNSCGSTVHIGKDNVTYTNAIFYNQMRHSERKVASDTRKSVMFQCSYPLAGLLRLFSMYKFDSETVGVGRIFHTTPSAEGAQTPSVEPTKAPRTTPAARRQMAFQAAFHPPAHYIRVSALQNYYGMKKGADGTSQIQMNPANI